VAGTPAGCSFGTTSKMVTLTLPNCPWVCDTVTVLSIPPPTVVDACGTVLSGLPPKVISIKKKPVVTATPDPVTACSDVPFNINLSSCVAGSSISWTGHSTSGTGTLITDAISNSTSTTNATDYIITATANGCTSLPDTVTVNTDPLPTADFSVNSPIIVNTPAVFTDNTTSHGGTVNSWNWSFGDSNSSNLQNPSHAYGTPGTYTVCLSMQTSDGCLDTICKEITVIPAELVLPNVITPNGDGQNDFLYFKYLEFFGDNELKVYDRWGKLVYEKSNYANDWNAKNCTDGTYYYTLLTADGKIHPGYVEILHNR
jgi:gliding motility-associated-like protein